MSSLNETHIRHLVEKQPPFTSFTPDSIISAFEETHGTVESYQKSLRLVERTLMLLARQGLVEMRDDDTFMNPGELMRPTKDQRIAQILDKLDADGVRAMYASDISRVCGYTRDDIIAYIKNHGHDRFRNHAPYGGGRVKILFLRNVGKRPTDPRRKGLSGKLKTADDMANTMITTLRGEFDITDDATLAELKIALLPTLTKIMNQ